MSRIGFDNPCLSNQETTLALCRLCAEGQTLHSRLTQVDRMWSRTSPYRRRTALTFLGVSFSSSSDRCLPKGDCRRACPPFIKRCGRRRGTSVLVGTGGPGGRRQGAACADRRRQARRHV